MRTKNIKSVKIKILTLFIKDCWLTTKENANFKKDCAVSSTNQLGTAVIGRGYTSSNSSTSSIDTWILRSSSFLYYVIYLLLLYFCVQISDYWRNKIFKHLTIVLHGFLQSFISVFNFRFLQIFSCFSSSRFILSPNNTNTKQK